MNTTRLNATDEQRHEFAGLLAEMCQDDRHRLTKSVSASSPGKLPVPKQAVPPNLLALTSDVNVALPR